MLLQLLANGIITGSLISIMAIGFGVIYSTTNFFHIAYGAVYMAAAYFMYTLLSWRLPFAVSIILSIFLTIIAGILIEFLVYKPLHKKRASHGIYLISSLGVYILIINIIALIFGNETKLLWNEMGAGLHLGEIILTKTQIIQFFTFILLSILSIIFMRVTRIGKTIQAMGCNARLLEFSGVNLQKMRYIVFAIGSFFAGIAAILTGLDVGLDPYMGMTPLLNAVTAVILGGVKRIEGAIAGAFFIGISQNLVVGYFSGRWESVVTFSILIVFFLYQSGGVLKMKKRAEEL
jgi:branched-chain amino acid transport system permease protein